MNLQALLKEIRQKEMPSQNLLKLYPQIYGLRANIVKNIIKLIKKHYNKPTDFKDYLRKQLKDKEFKKIYEEIEIK